MHRSGRVDMIIRLIDSRKDPVLLLAQIWARKNGLLNADHQSRSFSLCSTATATSTPLLFCLSSPATTATRQLTRSRHLSAYWLTWQKVQLQGRHGMSIPLITLKVPAVGRPSKDILRADHRTSSQPIWSLIRPALPIFLRYLLLTRRRTPHQRKTANITDSRVVI